MNNCSPTYYYMQNHGCLATQMSEEEEAALEKCLESAISLTKRKIRVYTIVPVVGSSEFKNIKEPRIGVVEREGQEC